MKLYRARQGCIVEHQGRRYSAANVLWDDLVTRDDLAEYLEARVAKLTGLELESSDLQDGLLAPIGQQEVWAAGVTYHRSRDARMEESESAGGGSFYDRVYNAERPELFFKATPHRVVGHNGKVAIRQDASWSVPEPELALLITPSGKIIFSGSTTLKELKREPATLVEYLYRDNSFPNGCFLLTGTGIVPPDSFSLQHGDEIRIAIDGIGSLTNFVG